MGAHLVGLTYAACGVLVAVYARERFSTPPSNRSSTRRALYWSSCAGYVLTALALYTVLSLLLQVAAWRTALLGNGDNASLPAPLIATLAMTTLLSSFPLLKQLDGWILSVFLDWAAIPAEVRRRAATMTTATFSVNAADVAVLQEAYGDSLYGETLASHLRDAGSDGIERSEFRLTRVVKLYHGLQALEGNTRYAKFFSDTADELKQLDARMARFMRHSDNALTLAARLRTLEGHAAYEELMQDRREAFAESCRDMFRDLSLFLARAALSAEPNEREIVRRLRALGFEAAEPMNEPDFPIDDLTLLALAIFAYLATLTMFFSHAKGVPQPVGSPMLMSFKIALVRIATVGVVIWLMQRFVFFRRDVGQKRKYFSYAVCGFVAAVAAAGVCLPFALIGSGTLAAELQGSVPTILLSGLLCTAVAFCCDDWPQSTAAPVWLRLAEAAACAAVMAFGSALVLFGGMVPASMGAFRGLMAVAFIALPGAMAAVIGGFVPHIYRSARRAAAACRTEAVSPVTRANPGSPAAGLLPAPARSSGVLVG